MSLSSLAPLLMNICLTAKEARHGADSRRKGAALHVLLASALPDLCIEDVHIMDAVSKHERTVSSP